jgi:chromosome segregation ATPase
MNFEAHARSQAQILLDAIANHVADTARSELDGLRAIVEERASALQEALSHPDQESIIARLVQDVSHAAREQAESTAAKARVEVEKRADAELAAARAVAAAQAEAAQAVNTALLGNIEEAQQQLRTAQAAARDEIDHTRQELEARVDQMQSAHAEAQQQMMAAQAARADSDRACQEHEARIAQMETTHAALAAELADTEGNVAAARSERDAQTANLEQAKNSAHLLHQTRQEL